MRVRVGCQFVHRTEAPVHAVLQVEPRLDAGLGIVEEHWENEPALPMSRYVDGFGNLCRRVSEARSTATTCRWRISSAT